MTLDELKQLPQWVTCSHKVPYMPGAGTRAAANKPATWSGYAEAKADVLLGKREGIGFVFAEGGGIVGIDFDHCLEGERLDPWVQDWVDRFNSYTEVSPSGTGLHILCLGKLPGRGLKRKKAEMYDHGRYFTVTEQTYGEKRPLREAQAEIDALYEELGAKGVSQQDKPMGTVPVPLTDDQLLAKAMSSRGGEKFKALWEGDITGYASQSEADVALCNHLAFWSNRDPVRVDRLFRKSGLMREKWDRPTGDSTYGAITVHNAVRTTVQGYDPEAYQLKEVHPRKARAAAEFGELEVEFIWYPYFPVGDYSVMMADGGTGKTILCCKIAADISTGKPLPGETKPYPGREVLIISAEDTGEILRVRLKESGGDLERVKIIDCTDSVGMNFSDAYEEFEATILSVAPALVVIDPWHAFLGPEININQVNELRPVLQRLANLAKKCKCALLLISHVNKRSQGDNANNAATGSSDFINAARAAVRVIFDETEDDHRIMVHTKANYSPYGKSVRYRVQGNAVSWEGFSEIKRATLEEAARRHTTPTALLQDRMDEDQADEALLLAIQNAEADRYTYAEFKNQYGEWIFNGRQPKRALDRVKKKLAADGILLKTGVRVQKDKVKGNGFLILKTENQTLGGDEE